MTNKQKKLVRRFRAKARLVCKIFCWHKSYKELKEHGFSEALVSFYEEGFKLGYTEKEIEIIIANARRRQYRSMNMARPRWLVKRDNHAFGLNYGSMDGGWRMDAVRYPSKKRSRRTWTNFYRLFPKLAEKDGWDGKNSERMR